MSRNNGRIREISSMMTTPSTGTMITSREDSLTSWLSAIRMPPTIMMGAATIMVSVITTSICTCWTSLVVRVISDGVPNFPTSRAENDWTRSNSAPRMSRPSAIAVRAPKYTAVTEQAICTSDTAIITPPVLRM